MSAHSLAESLAALAALVAVCLLYITAHRLPPATCHLALAGPTVHIAGHPIPLFLPLRPRARRLALRTALYNCHGVGTTSRVLLVIDCMVLHALLALIALITLIALIALYRYDVSVLLEPLDKAEMVWQLDAAGLAAGRAEREAALREWTIYRRYSQFDELKNCMAKAFPEAVKNCVKFPPKVKLTALCLFLSCCHPGCLRGSTGQSPAVRPAFRCALQPHTA